MPTYEYQCDACGRKFELFQSMTAEPVKKCALCGKRKVHRLIGTGAGIIFKGSGFYATDYRSESYKTAAQKDKSDGAAATSGKSSPAKPAEGGSAASGGTAGSANAAGGSQDSAKSDSKSDAKPRKGKRG